MHLDCLGSDDPRFKRLEFHSGFNLILADKTEDSGATDSRNGAGKTSIIRLLRYLLGGKATPWINNLKEYTEGEFYAKFITGNKPIEVKRALGSNEIICNNSTLDTKSYQYQIGIELFGFNHKHVKPTVAQVYSHLIREDFSDPIKIHPSESHQVSGARIGYYLGISEKALEKAAVASSFESNKKALNKAVKDGIIGGLGPNKAECKSDLASLEQRRDRLANRLTSFQIDEHYLGHQSRADKLSQKIVQLNDTGISLRSRLNALEAATKQDFTTLDNALVSSRIERLYKETGAVLPNCVLKSFQDVMEFHKSVTRNRKLFLEEELHNVQEELRDNDKLVQKLDEERAEILELLSTSMALEAYTKAQEDLTDLDAQIAKLKLRIEDYERLEDMDSSLKRMRLDAIESVKTELKDNDDAINEITSLFVSICEEIYSDRKARLLFEVTNKGVLKVEPKIDGDDSKGIKEVSIFAFDLACVIIGSEGGYIPGFLIHDSHLFDAMNDRQLCSCLNIGARLSDEYGLQYIVLLNTDRLEAVELIGFDRANYPIETILTDKGDHSGLFGFRFN